jgi:hypothetical protein
MQQHQLGTGRHAPGGSVNHENRNLPVGQVIFISLAQFPSGINRPHRFQLFNISILPLHGLRYLADLTGTDAAGFFPSWMTPYKEAHPRAKGSAESMPTGGSEGNEMDI